MEIEDACDSPERLAAEIIRQIEPVNGAVPVEAIARALDIVEIRREPLRNIEAALIAEPDRSFGAIIVNGNSKPARQRFGIAHELAHFLISRHASTQGSNFVCTKTDMVAVKSVERAQEAEANRFAIELLAPPALIKPFLRGFPDLAKAIAVADRCEISREAAARRYVQLHAEPLAVVFAQNRRIIYFQVADRFPRLSLRGKDELPVTLDASPLRGLTTMDEIDPRDWLRTPGDVVLGAQTLWQAEGYSITLLHADIEDVDE